MSATTDSEMVIKYDPDNKPGISNLLNIYVSLTGKSIEEAQEEFEGSNYGEFKRRVADVVCDTISEIQAKYNEIINSDIIDKVLLDGKEKTIKEAEKKYNLAKSKMGFYN